MALKITDTFSGSGEPPVGIDRMVEAILQEEKWSEQGQVEAIQSDIAVITAMIQFMLENMREDVQAEFINKFSCRFLAESVEPTKKEK